MLFWASLTHSIASGLPWPILSFWASSAHSNSLFPWTFAKSFGLPRQPKLPYPLLLGFMGFPSAPYSLNSLLQASLAHSRLLSISYDVHGFTSSFFWTPLGPLAFFEAHLLLSRPMIHYSCYSGLMVFFSIYQFFFLPYCWASSCYWASLPKWASTLKNDRLSNATNVSLVVDCRLHLSQIP